MSYFNASQRGFGEFGFEVNDVLGCLRWIGRRGGRSSNATSCHGGEHLYEMRLVLAKELAVLIQYIVVTVGKACTSTTALLVEYSRFQHALPSPPWYRWSSVQREFFESGSADKLKHGLDEISCKLALRRISCTSQMRRRRKRTMVEDINYI